MYKNAIKSLWYYKAIKGISHWNVHRETKKKTNQTNFITKRSSHIFDQLDVQQHSHNWQLELDFGLKNVHITWAAMLMFFIGFPLWFYMWSIMFRRHHQAIERAPSADKYIYSERGIKRMKKIHVGWFISANLICLLNMQNMHCLTA